MYKVILPFRYLFKKRISYVAFLAVALCVFIVVVVMTVMRGLVTDFKQKNHNFAGDCVVASDSLAGFAYYEEFMETLSKPSPLSSLALH
jgi:ABC-type lipoprotein release transport system permease subunit